VAPGEIVRLLGVTVMDESYPRRVVVKVAVTVVFAFSENEHVPVPEHPPPDHPEKVDFFVAGVAVSVTTVPSL